MIDCSVKDIPVYENMYIKKAELYHYKNADSSGLPVNSSKVLVVYENSIPDTTVKSIRKCVSATILATSVIGVEDFKNQLFYVKITCDGTLGAEISQYACGMDNTVDIGIAPDWKALYDSGMGFITALSGCHALCNPPKGYEQFILNWFAIRLAILACDYDGLALAWDRYFRINVCASSSPALGQVSGCGCR